MGATRLVDVDVGVNQSWHHDEITEVDLSRQVGDLCDRPLDDPDRSGPHLVTDHDPAAAYE
jgi:hypothetical protein